MNEINYPPGCKDIQVDIPNDELIRRLKVCFDFLKHFYQIKCFISNNRKSNKHIRILSKHLMKNINN